jgi:hypothetical protein
MLLDESHDLIEFAASEIMTSFDSHWVEPNFHFRVVPFNVNMRRLSTVAGIEEKPVRTRAEDGWHLFMLLAQLSNSNVGTTGAIGT